MILLVFSVYDAAAEAYLEPMFFGTKGMAVRSFSDAINAEDHAFGRHAADFTLFHIGMFDQSSGVLKALDTPDSLGVAVQYLERVPSVDIKDMSYKEITA